MAVSRSLQIVFAALVVGTVVFSSPSAHAEWTKTESFEHSAKTSLKILEPADAHAFVTIQNETKEGTLPHIWSLADEDAFISVKIVAANGESWTGKVEVKAHKQTVLKLAQIAKAPAAPAPAGQKFIGRMENTTHRCSGNERQELKYVAMKDGKPALEKTVSPNRSIGNLELEAGHYTVRVFKHSTNDFIQTKDLDVAKDGWTFSWGCP